MLYYIFSAGSDEDDRPTASVLRQASLDTLRRHGAEPVRHVDRDAVHLDLPLRPRRRSGHARRLRHVFLDLRRGAVPADRRRGLRPLRAAGGAGRRPGAADRQLPPAGLVGERARPLRLLPGLPDADPRRRRPVQAHPERDRSGHRAARTADGGVRHPADSHEHRLRHRPGGRRADGVAVLLVHVLPDGDHEHVLPPHRAALHRRHAHVPAGEEPADRASARSSRTGRSWRSQC